MPRCVLSFFFLVFSLFTKQRQKSRWWITEKSEEICLNLCPRPPFSLVSSCSLLVRALERTLSTQPGARWRNTQPSWREPNNRGRCPETQFSSRRGVSRAILREYLSPCLSLSSPPVLKVFLPPPPSPFSLRGYERTCWLLNTNLYGYARAHVQYVWTCVGLRLGSGPRMKTILPFDEYLSIILSICGAVAWFIKCQIMVKTSQSLVPNAWKWRPQMSRFCPQPDDIQSVCHRVFKKLESEKTWLFYVITKTLWDTRAHSMTCALYTVTVYVCEGALAKTSRFT